MWRLTTSGTAIVLAALFLGLAPRASLGQLRRLAPPGSALPGPPPPADTPPGASSKRPFVGVWDGSLTLSRGPGADREHPITMVFAASDSSAPGYSGFTILPDGGRTPHLETVVARGALRWKQPNSGGGFWLYSANLVRHDSIAGTVVLRDWPQRPRGEEDPAGTFALTRRQVRR